METASFILKGIGFLVLLVLGILLLHLILLLLIPFRYRCKGRFQEQKAGADAELWWLSGYIRAAAKLSEGGILQVSLKVLGFSVWKCEKKLSLPVRDAEKEISLSQPPPENNGFSARQAEDGLVQEQAGFKKARLKGEDLIEAAEIKAKAAGTKLSTATERLKTYREFFFSPSCRKVFLQIWEGIRKPLLELRPTEGEGELSFGTGDPYVTGQLLELAALLYPFYGGILEVVPYFDETVFFLKMDVQGRFRLSVLLQAALRLYFSKDVQTLVREFREVAEHG